MLTLDSRRDNSASRSQPNRVTRAFFCAASALLILRVSAAGQEPDRRCELSTASFDAGMQELDYGGWKVFVDPANKENVFEICINGGQLIVGAGVLAGSQAIRVDGGDLAVETGIPAKRIPAHDLQAGRISGYGFKTDHGAVYDIVEHYLYRLALADLSQEAIAKRGKKGLSVFMTEAAWARFAIDALSAQRMRMDITWRRKDGAAAAALIKKGFGTADAARSPLKDPADIKKIADFVHRGVDRFKDKSGKAYVPGVSIDLKVNKEHAEKKKPRFVVSMFPQGPQAAKLPEEDRAFVLLWCSYPNPRNGGKPYGLETLQEHEAHLKAD